MSRMIGIGTSSESHLEAVLCTANDGGLDVKEVRWLARRNVAPRI
ncbi:uncharacterized protein G2W53_021754 [Senna tora]|uniref:Uncharacterized protein n=1 Tax=Senna tora TaxID=362788 RepID=A0A834WHI9_9FABA|nr:uncharacterized protein G2W53_021754 [Senna tora]